MSDLGTTLSLYSVIPFIGMLLSIALFPLFMPKFWHQNFGKISLFWALITAVPLLIFYKKIALYHIMYVMIAKYIPFIILLSSLYIICGNIYLYGNYVSTPLFNTAFLALGTGLASLMGTTGASMVLIRYFIRINNWRKNNTYQIIFFIFLVSNIGGSLTPLGDPPLYLGYLKGVPFFWTLNLFWPTLICVFLLLILFYVIDTHNFKKYKNLAPEIEGERGFRIQGIHNLIFLVSIPLIILITGNLKLPSLNLFGIERPIQELLRDLIFILLALLSFFLTSEKIRMKNEFTFFPIKEVAILFFGIFISMIPALSILQAGEKGALSSLITLLREPAHYFWITGILSAFLDNAPTYLTLLSCCLGNFYPGLPEKEALTLLIKEKASFLLAISCGAVFFGACTYIGNAPNFMVRSIAEEKGIPMPSFLGYLVKYSLTMLLPIFILLTLIFFRG